MRINPFVYKDDVEGSWSEQSEKDKELITYLVAHFHYRDGVPRPDGSMGTISISSAQFNDCLAFMLNWRDTHED
jgi:hypothetical protein